ncbi:adenylyltransferase/sulfurtransferase MoeZ [Corynebacterium heidelbergense]|uniref:Adenylyltransferase/sulfurtransferase MoeZ n=1 Tax=Corynebacterium heidelbergense TaxID=2055947 RepID=A0A364VB17_9CORY|nr:adenylyltransferase/sulfurtransferase MoeZ [Corynebacterium heidelbergense]
MPELIPELTAADRARYARHLSLIGFGESAQRRLKGARVLVIGAGGLGSPVLLYLAAAGVGTITVLDADLVEASNLQRQVIHAESAEGMNKASSAAQAALRLNSLIDVTALPELLTPDNAVRLFSQHDLVVDGSDNFATRYLSSDASEITHTPLVWATISQFQGQMSVFHPPEGPSLRDLFPEIPDPDSVPSCAVGGVLGALPGMIGAAMAIEAIKVLTGVGDPTIGRLVLFDVLDMRTREVAFSRDPGRAPVRELGSDTLAACASSLPVPQVSAQQLRTELQAGEPSRRPLLIDVREAHEREAEGSIPGARHIPLDRLLSAGWGGVPKHKEDGDVVVYCHAGGRSATAVRALAPQAPEGTRLRSLAGGMLAWNLQQHS